jgi:hypothetical protein
MYLRRAATREGRIELPDGELPPCISMQNLQL